MRGVLRLHRLRDATGRLGVGSEEPGGAARSIQSDSVTHHAILQR
jgi:hypothetical protein